MSEKDFIEMNYQKPSEKELIENSAKFFEQMASRRSGREFSSEPVSIDVIFNICKAAVTSPSGGNRQPFFYCIVKDKSIKHKIRLSAEKEEKLNYEKRFTSEFLSAVGKFKTNYYKPFLDEAPVLVAVFAEKYKKHEDKIEKNYFFTESTCISIGVFITAVHSVGLVTLPYTPRPIKFLNEILNISENLSPVMILPIGYPKEGLMIPNLRKKTFDELCKVF